MSLKKKFEQVFAKIGFSDNQYEYLLDYFDNSPELTSMLTQVMDEKDGHAPWCHAIEIIMEARGLMLYKTTPNGWLLDYQGGRDFLPNDDHVYADVIDELRGAFPAYYPSPQVQGPQVPQVHGPQEEKEKGKAKGPNKGPKKALSQEGFKAAYDINTLLAKFSNREVTEILSLVAVLHNQKVMNIDRVVSPPVNTQVNKDSPKVKELPKGRSQTPPAPWKLQDSFKAAENERLTAKADLAKAVGDDARNACIRRIQAAQEQMKKIRADFNAGK
jgi:hypothetical protein